jgi:phosphotransferase system HPr (HPr) family protein
MRKRVQARFVVPNELGIHARAAAQLVSVAIDSEAEIWARTKNSTVNAESLLGLLSLGASKGSPITFLAMGPDAEMAMHMISELFESSFECVESKAAEAYCSC